MKKIVSLILVFATLVMCCSCGATGDDTLSLTAMNTVMQITVFNNSKAENERVKGLLSDRIMEIDRLMDVNNPESDVYSINNGKAGSDISVSPETADIIAKSLEATQLTDNSFNIAVMPVVKLWGFHDGTYGVPSNENINKALSCVNPNGITVNTDNSVKKSMGVEITLGGIAKGYLGDELLKITKAEGVTALLSLGGNIVLCGDKADGSLWSVGVKNPYDAQGLACSFKSKGNKSVVTSGGYERYFEYGGKTYHHIIDPKTGYPAESNLLSVTVIGECGALCDAYSTGLYVMGKEKAVAFAKENNSFDFIFITTDNEILYTNGVAEIELSDNAFTLTAIQ